MGDMMIDAHSWLAQFALVPLAMSWIFYLLVRWLPVGGLREEWGVLARWSLWLGTGFLVAAAVSGALSAVDGAPPGLARNALAGHAYWAYAALAAYLVVFGWSIWGYRRYLRSAREQGLPFLLVGLLALALLVMAVGRGAGLRERAAGVAAAPAADIEAVSAPSGPMTAAGRRLISRRAPDTIIR